MGTNLFPYVPVAAQERYDDSYQPRPDLSTAHTALDGGNLTPLFCLDVSDDSSPSHYSRQREPRNHTRLATYIVLNKHNRSRPIVSPIRQTLVAACGSSSPTSTSFKPFNYYSTLRANQAWAALMHATVYHTDDTAVPSIVGNCEKEKEEKRYSIAITSKHKMRFYFFRHARRELGLATDFKKPGSIAEMSKTDSNAENIQLIRENLIVTISKTTAVRYSQESPILNPHATHCHSIMADSMYGLSERATDSTLVDECISSTP
ncbi:unnamed protein product [Fusarium equiseti]|uniref:Uncharacterized protein n=1 Tax=Fusarium equiseti TaxID=61235 RepID=A0A8J2IKY5_FUSEQ|nr:unnamed protein product [Fusarium equiseti]